MHKNKWKKQKDTGSIVLGEAVKVRTVTNYNSYSWIYFLQIIFIWFGIYLPIVCFTSSFDIVYRKDIFILYSILSTIFYWLLFYFYKYLKYTIPITMVAFLYIILKYKAYIINGFYYLENAIIDKLNQYFDMSIVRYKAELSREICFTFLLILILQGFGIVVALLIVRAKQKRVYIFISSIFVFSGLVVGVVPNAYALTMYIIFIYTISSMSITTMHNKMNLKREETIITETKFDYKQIVRLKVGFIVSALLGLGIIIIMLVFSPNTYEEQVDFSNTKHKIQSQLFRFSFEDFFNDINNKLGENSFFKKKGTSNGKGSKGGGLPGGKLSTDAFVEFANNTVFQLTMPVEAGSLYLKGYAGAVYSGESWNDLNETEKKQYQEIVTTYGDNRFTGDNLASMYMKLLTSGVVTYEVDKLLGLSENEKHILSRFDMDIQYVAANEGFMYAPYFLSELPQGDFIATSDLYIKPKKERNEYAYSFYKFSTGYYINGNLNKLRNLQNSIVIQNGDEYKKFSVFENNYRKFVYDTYVGIPVDQFKQIQELNLGVSKAYDMDSMIAVVEKVINYLQETTTYTLSPGPLPNGKDYIEYFLFESRKGYCAHYASAAVILLRYYGVPARYVEGYIVTDQDIRKGSIGDKMYPQVTCNASGEETINQVANTTVEIRDTNAHAWVEVYLDGVGWVPVEVTAGYSAQGIEAIDETIRSEVVDLPTPTPLPTKQPKPTPTLKPESEEKAPLSPTISNAPGNVTNGPNANQTVKEETLRDKLSSDVLRLIILIVSFVVVLFLAVFIRYSIKHYMGEKKKRDMFHRNEAALYLYSRIEEMIRILRIQKNEEETYEEFFKRVEKNYKALPVGDKEILSLLRKARFSNQRLSKEEYDKILSYYIEFRTIFYTQFKKMKQFYIKYWKNI